MAIHKMMMRGLLGRGKRGSNTFSGYADSFGFADGFCPPYLFFHHARHVQSGRGIWANIWSPIYRFNVQGG